ncbi:MAG TPA: glyceraldehyde 3-phosphate dehydrogenase NAD-binding domain-containing protein [Woeseiaceae bacterium]|nr:glyceraldehyde 3-phosphate dehydrogenase NAD-binding domain-containing protein [Woeseiaceae bacterium]
MANVAINGLGRIGRATLRQLVGHPKLRLVGANDLTSLDNLAYLLRYDSVYGRSTGIEVDADALVLQGERIPVFHEPEPSSLPWKRLDVDLVFECTGRFTNREALEGHLRAGARKAILSAPSKKDDMPFVVPGVNESGDAEVFCVASCTTNCIAPVVEIVGRRLGVLKAAMTTVHAYTSSQAIVDAPAKRPERGRAGAVNLVPTSTGAAKAATAVLPPYAGKFDGLAIRAPVPTGSVADITFLVERKTTVDEVNGIFVEEADTPRYRGILEVSQDDLVSTDIIGKASASIIALPLTRVVDGDLLKVFAWYDNEWGYAAQMIREAEKAT